MRGQWLLLLERLVRDCVSVGSPSDAPDDAPAPSENLAGSTSALPGDGVLTE